MSDTAEAHYLRHRAEGKTCSEAARLAGYAGRPPWRVRKLASKIPSLRREPGLCAHLDREVDQLNRRIAQLTEQRDAKRGILQLCAALDGLTG
jgi:hypothetical protein